MKRSLIYNGLEEFVHYWVMSLWLVSTYRWQTRMTSVNWAVFAAPCLMFLDHNWDQRWRSISLADAANGRNIPPFSFSFFRVCCHKKINSLSLIITRVNIYNYMLIKLQKRCYARALVQNFVATFPEAIFWHAGIFYILCCNFSVPQSLGIFTYIYSNQIYLRFLHVLQFL